MMTLRPGRSPYNDVLFGPPGYTDVYLIYGLHYCLNVSCLPDGEAGGVLIRALDPIEGIETMTRLRGLPETASSELLTGGPGRLCQALGIKRAPHHVRRPLFFHLSMTESCGRPIQRLQEKGQIYE
jgi:DNA-3-methyladenine glycosylase